MPTSYFFANRFTTTPQGAAIAQKQIFSTLLRVGSGMTGTPSDTYRVFEGGRAKVRRAR